MRLKGQGFRKKKYDKKRNKIDQHEVQAADKVLIRE